MARLYNKTEELRSQHADDSEKARTEKAVWRAAGWDGDAAVWRLEAQVRGSVLEELGARAPHNLQERLDPVWKYAFGDSAKKGPSGWIRLIAPNSANRRERCKLDRRWRTFQTAHFGASSSTPAQRVPGRGSGIKIEQAFGGMLSHLGSSALLNEASSDDAAAEIGAATHAFLNAITSNISPREIAHKLAIVKARFALLAEEPTPQGAARGGK